MHLAILLISSFLLVLSGWAEVPNDPFEDIDWDFSVNRVFYWPSVGSECIIEDWPQEVDSYWIDSWVADAQGDCWYSPEKYEFERGDVIAAVTFYAVSRNYMWGERYDAFYFCGDTEPRNYIAYGWSTLSWYPYKAFICAIFYDTGIIPDKFLPVVVDWASRKYYIDWGEIMETAYGGIPLSGRPACFVIEKEP